jgi:hypothetical protein
MRERPEGVAAVVPDHGGGAEADAVAGVLDAPAEVDVVAGGAVAGVEAADLFEDGASEGHVAAGDVFGGGVVEEDVGGSAGGVGDAGGDGAVAGGWDVGSAGAAEVVAFDGGDEVVEPVGVGAGVVVGVGDDVAGGGLPGGVAGVGEAAVLGADEADVVAGGDVGGGVGGAVVDDDDFVVGVVEGGGAVEGVGEGAGAVVGADGDGDAGPGAVGEGDGGVGVADGGEGGFGLALAVDEAEVPVVDGGAAAVPFVGPGEDVGAGAAGLEDGLDLPGEGVGLGVEAVALAVEADFGHDEGFVAGEVLEAGEVGLEAVAVFEVDVEADEVDEGEVEVLGGGVVDVGDEGVGVFGADGSGESF